MLSNYKKIMKRKIGKDFKFIDFMVGKIRKNISHLFLACGLAKKRTNVCLQT